MRVICKHAEPDEFSEWKINDRMAHRPRWKRVPTCIKHIVHRTLISEQGDICCYCERRVSEDNSHVEHFRPINRFKDLQLEYGNLHCSCQKNLEKNDLRQCGNGKGSWFDEQELISPLDDDCELRFKFTGIGEIFPRREDDSAASTTIKMLRLDHEKLNAMRASAIDALIDLEPEDIQLLLDDSQEGNLLEFQSTIKQILG